MGMEDFLSVLLSGVAGAGNEVNTQYQTQQKDAKDLALAKQKRALDLQDMITKIGLEASFKQKGEEFGLPDPFSIVQKLTGAQQPQVPQQTPNLSLNNGPKRSGFILPTANPVSVNPTQEQIAAEIARRKGIQ